MATDEAKEPTKKPVTHQVSLSAKAEGTVTVHAMVLGGLPDLTAEQARAFYNHTLQSLKPTRVRGFYGVVDGGPERDDDVALLMYNEDKMAPVLMLTMSRSDLVAFSEALNDLVEQRFRRG
jgi:hypothetical protein